MDTKRIVAILALIALASVTGCAQAPAGKKSFTFRGKVEAVDTKDAKLTVHNENVPGWMGEMTMAYKVDNPEVIKSLKSGDQIEATVYEGDEVLHKVKPVKPNK